MQSDMSEMPASTKSLNLFSQYLFIVEGSVVLIFNALLALLILFTKKFANQKEYVFLAVNLLSDAVFGLQYVLAGARYIFIVTQNEYIPETTRWDCYTTVFNQLFIIVTPAMGLFSLANAMDRLFLISFPGRYHNLGRFYPFGIVGAVFLCCLPTTVMAFWQALYLPNESVPSTCQTHFATTMVLQMMLRSIRIATSVIAAFLYIPIVIKIRATLRTSGATGNTFKKEVKLTFTIAMITLNQLVLFTLPDILILCKIMFIELYIMNLNKGIINILIIVFCQRDIRRYILTRGKTTSTTLPNQTAVDVLKYDSRKKITSIIA